MGNRQSKQIQQLDAKLLQDKHKHDRVKKLLLLGSGESGVHTIYRQLRMMYGEEFADKDRLSYKGHIFKQIIEQMRLCLKCIDILKAKEPDKYEDLKLSDQGKQAAHTIQSAQTFKVCAT